MAFKSKLTFQRFLYNVRFKQLGALMLMIGVILVIIGKLSFQGIVHRRHSENLSSTELVKNDVEEQRDTHKFKTILLWTPFFGVKDYIPPLDKQGCAETRCNITSNRNLLSESSAIIFHHRDLNPRDIPTVRYPWQRWVYLNHESPSNSLPDSIVNLENSFNWTITYRLDSDILLTPLPRLQKIPLSIDNRDISQKKTRMAVWFVSNCHTPSRREDYVAELRKVIPVDIYGDCGPKRCIPKMSTQCYKDVETHYRFYLSFENSICRDYLTEKFYHVLQYNMVPVVFGGADYTKLAPPGSYISAMDFSSPRELGRYLLDIAKSPEKYNSFFNWRKTHETVLVPYACQLCQKLHNYNEPEKSWTNLNKWWFEEAQCSHWST